MGELIQFIPRSRSSRDSDFPTIVFKAPIAPANAHERAIAEDTAPCEMPFEAPADDCA